MASASPGKEDDLTVCAICLEQFNNPRYLPCLHTFCEACLSKYITSASGKGTNTKPGFLCPTCRMFTEITNKDNIPDQQAKQFPLNHLIVTLIDRQKAQGKGKICDSCTRINKSNKADHWCNNCAETLCPECKICHLGNRYTMNHDIVPLSELSDDIRPNVNVLCSQHPDKKLEIYCYEYEAPCCAVCLAVFHRSCSKMNTIEEAAKEIRKDGDLLSLQQSFQSIRQNIDEKINSRKERQKHLQYSEMSMKEEIRSIRQQINAHLDNLEARLLQQVSNLYKAHTRGVDNQQDLLQTWRSVADHCIKLIDTCQNNISDIHVLLELKRLRTKEKEMEEFYNSDDIKIRDVEIKLEIAENVSDLTSVITSFGDVAEVIKGAQDAIEALRYNFHLSTPSLILTLPDTRVSSAAFLPNSCVLLVHFWDDKKVTLIDVNGKCLSSLSLPDQPWDVTLVSPQQAVVTLPYKEQLVYINIDQSTLAVHKTVTLGMECRGICCLDQTLLVTYPTQLNVLDLQGNVLNTVNIHDSKELYFVTTYNDKIYLSDYDKHCVLITDKQGQEISRYTSDKLRLTWKITTDCEGNIYVVGHTSDNVHQLTSDGKLIRILPVVIKRPTCVVFEENSNRFLVSAYHDKKTMVYSME